MVNSRKPKLTAPSTPITRAVNASGSSRLNAATARVHAARISAHSSSEPSWEPHTADRR